MDRQPVVAVTIGDVAGIGPEVVAKALAHAEVRESCCPLVIGDLRVFIDPKFAAPFDDLVPVESVDHPDGGVQDVCASGGVPLLDLHNVRPGEIPIGEISAVAGGAAVAYVLKAAELAMAGRVDAVATAPLNKEAMRLAGYHYIGHTEILTELTEAAHVTTMLATPGLRVTHVTRHIPFHKIAPQITTARVLETIVITYDGMRNLGYAHPRLAVAGLNPHNGEGGLLGREELDEIAPAVALAQARGIDAQGPIPADSVFFQAIRGDYDAVVTMYHDQGHIAVKTHGFEKSITITLGLPIIRTSADHGTAFDIAGKGIAAEDSIVAAIVEAALMARQRRQLAADANILAG
ncbi:MAG: 4-hydroxythreonine-4-phosphate dehydrogenase PdxA [Anaerolineae bacterium]|nr:4-hydroxythreonine-4-phosphate dehydrogenase PdxA [Anaerolineae bacterium]